MTKKKQSKASSLTVFLTDFQASSSWDDTSLELPSYNAASFATAPSAAQAQQSLGSSNSYAAGSRSHGMQGSSSSYAPSSQSFTVCVGNLGRNTNVDDLAGLFEKVNCSIKKIDMTNNESGRGKGNQAYIEFSDKQSLNSALSLNSFLHNGSRIRVDIVESSSYGYKKNNANRGSSGYANSREPSSFENRGSWRNDHQARADGGMGSSGSFGFGSKGASAGSALAFSSAPRSGPEGLSVANKPFKPNPFGDATYFDRPARSAQTSNAPTAAAAVETTNRAVVPKSDPFGGAKPVDIKPIGVDRTPETVAKVDIELAGTPPDATKMVSNSAAVEPRNETINQEKAQTQVKPRRVNPFGNARPVDTSHVYLRPSAQQPGPDSVSPGKKEEETEEVSKPAVVIQKRQEERPSRPNVAAPVQNMVAAVDSPEIAVAVPRIASSSFITRSGDTSSKTSERYSGPAQAPVKDEYSDLSIEQVVLKVASNKPKTKIDPFAGAKPADTASVLARHMEKLKQSEKEQEIKHAAHQGARATEEASASVQNVEVLKANEQEFRSRGSQQIRQGSFDKSHKSKSGVSEKSANVEHTGEQYEGDDVRNVQRGTFTGDRGANRDRNRSNRRSSRSEGVASTHANERPESSGNKTQTEYSVSRMVAQVGTNQQVVAEPIGEAVVSREAEESGYAKKKKPDFVPDAGGDGFVIVSIRKAKKPVGNAPAGNGGSRNRKGD